MIAGPKNGDSPIGSRADGKPINWPSRVDGARSQKMMGIDVRPTCALIEPSHDCAATAIRDDLYAQLEAGCSTDGAARCVPCRVNAPVCSYMLRINVEAEAAIVLPCHECPTGAIRRTHLGGLTARRRYDRDALIWRLSLSRQGPNQAHGQNENNQQRTMPDHDGLHVERGPRPGGDSLKAWRACPSLPILHRRQTKRDDFFARVGRERFRSRLFLLPSGRTGSAGRRLRTKGHR